MLLQIYGIIHTSQFSFAAFLPEIVNMSQIKETLILTPAELRGEGIRGRHAAGARVLIIDPKVLFSQNFGQLLGGEKTRGYLKRLNEDDVELCIAMHGSKTDAEEIHGQLIDLGISHQFKFIVHEEPLLVENNIIGAIQYAYNL